MTAVEVVDGIDAGAIAHYGNPAVEGRALDDGTGVVDLSHRDVITVSGPDRLGWLHDLTTQHFTALAVGEGTSALILDAQGHIEHVMYGVDDGDTFFAHTEPGRGAALVQFLDSMRFMRRVDVALRTDDLAVVWQPGDAPDGRITRQGADSLGGHESFIPRGHLSDFLERIAGPRVGLWAWEARRVAAGVPRIGVDTDHRTIPNELGVLGVSVHLEKGCYRGQETVARVHTLGRPPRRLTLLHLDGSMDALPEVGADLALAEKPDRVVGRVGSSARHHELGPIALALLKRNVPVEAPIVVGDIAAAQETIVDPEVGLHVRPLR